MYLEKQKMERHRMVSELVRSLSGLHPQRRGGIRGKTQWNYYGQLETWVTPELAS